MSVSWCFLVPPPKRTINWSPSLARYIRHPGPQSIFVFTTTVNSFDCRSEAALHAQLSRHHFSGGFGIEAIEPFLVRAGAVFQEVLLNLHSLMVTRMLPLVNRADSLSERVRLVFVCAKARPMIVRRLVRAINCRDNNIAFEFDIQPLIINTYETALRAKVINIFGG